MRYMDGSVVGTRSVLEKAGVPFNDLVGIQNSPSGTITRAQLVDRIDRGDGVFGWPGWMTDVRCETCNSFHAPGSDVRAKGQCRFNAANRYGSWPEVPRSEWCREHRIG